MAAHRTNIRTLVLTVFGLGLIRPAPGTWGSLPPVAIALMVVWLAWPERWMVEAALMLLGLIFVIACARFGMEAEAIYGEKDPQSVVADEVAGQVLPLMFLPWREPVDWEGWRWNLAIAVTAFVAFRFFDIVKVPPARESQRMGGGWGILVDDLVAGVYALVATQVLVRLVLAGFM